MVEKKEELLEEIFGEELVIFLKEFCKWTGKDVRDYIEDAIIKGIEADLDTLTGIKGLIPRVKDFLLRFSELKLRRVEIEGIEGYE